MLFYANWFLRICLPLVAFAVFYGALRGSAPMRDAVGISLMAASVWVMSA